MFIAFLQRKNLFDPEIYIYINDYWEDIIQLVQNPLGDDEKKGYISER